MIKENKIMAIVAYITLNLFFSSSFSGARFVTGKKTNNPVTAKIIPTAESNGAMIENYLTPSIFLKPVNAKILIPITAAVVMTNASKTSYGLEAKEIFATMMLVQTVNKARRM
jgi:hypothetical protein